MKVIHNVSLKPYNTFGIDVRASKFIKIQSIEDLKKILRKTYAEELFILGGGSNMLLTGDIHKTVLQIDLKGKEVVEEKNDYVIIKAHAGENWHEFVLWTLEQNFGGLENLSLIPGNVGTSPIQNIGAYGVELKDNFVSCEAINIQTLESRTFTLEDCDFGYRNSVFKNKLKGQYIITSVNFKLSSKNHQLKMDYGAIRTELEALESPTIKDISNAVIKIRESKLPNPAEIGNSGSFFKNPVISAEAFNNLQKQFPEIPSYPISATEVKVPAGWLIDQSGLKGYRDGDAGVHKKQALVLVNYGNASGSDILMLSIKVREVVKEKFGIDLEPEVNII
ncbi:UDP-N-acetylmuramate dehydrogenase [Zunongwangia atlantica]|uniref:UDP-N-acetylenolpyruvoylglucosamine reductase n=1 Tax=Zunongwangia atlantica 22II14-10F7 TaxID=1185767 RepID=A0A1Y1T498_9FLAO|nr:UDP-N-acetylmuramate dehydrogenase [Zunongwangia atlantica]ORL45856.1 UDP-N-acetylenolpyruvoylglucosamine reductase [Zunongwangia atlantica 22II14-10F7]